MLRSALAALVVVGVLLPVVRAEAVAPDPDGWRLTLPAVSAAPSWKAPVAEVLTLGNGLTVYLVTDRALPVVDVALVVNVGREANPQGKAGLVALTARTMLAGTTRRSAAELDGAARALGATLRAGADDESSFVRLHAPSGAALPGALDLLADVALRPRLDRAGFLRAREQAVAVAGAAVDPPAALAEAWLRAQLYGTLHPYGRPALGTPDTLAALRLGDVQRVYRTSWQAGAAALVVAGDLDSTEARALLQPRFGTWRPRDTVRRVVAPAAAPLHTRIVYVERPLAERSVLALGVPAPMRGSPDFPAARLLTAWLGDVASSPLWRSTDEGWTNVEVDLRESRDAGELRLTVAVPAAAAAEAVGALLARVKDACRVGPSASELDVARAALLAALPAAYATPAMTVDAVSVIPRLGLKPDALALEPDRWAGVTPGDVASLCARVLDPARVLVVVVAPPSTGPGQSTRDALGALGHELVVRPATAP